MESTHNLDILELDELYKSARDLYEQKYYDASVIYGRKLVEKFLSTFVNYEEIDFYNSLTPLGIIRKIPIKLNKLRYLNISFYDIRIILENLIRLGNMGAHEKVNTLEIPDNYLKDLESINIWFREYIDDKYLKTALINSKDKHLPNYIIDFQIKNYQCVYDLRIDNLDSDAQFIVFTGENGYGKTSILQAIAIGLCGNIDEQSNELLLNNENSVIGVSLFQNNGVTRQIFNNKDFKTSKITSNIVAYGASRLQIEAPETMFEYNKKRSPIYSLFHTGAARWNRSGCIPR